MLTNQLDGTNAIEGTNDHIWISEKPINLFKIQIIISENKTKGKDIFETTIFKNRRIFIYENVVNENFGEILKNLNLKNFTVYCPNEAKYIQFQRHFIKEFGNSNIKVLKSNILLDDIEDEEKAFKIIERNI